MAAAGTTSKNASTATAAAFRHAVLRLSRRLRKRAQYGLSPTQTSVLTTIERHGQLLIGELTRSEQVSKSQMTRIIAKLEGEGLVTRAVDPADRRGFLVTLTDRGAQVLRAAATRQDEYLARQLDSLSPADRKLIEAALPAIERLLEQ